jgi:pyruvate dehydrogenase E2 component (dihydrolipoamide acetyltransferase)
MAFNFYMPDIGEGVVEGEIVTWKVKEGDHVKLDQPLVEVMTDKATVELPSPRAGKIVKIHFQDGQICPVGQILVVIEEDAGAGKPAAPAAAPAAPAKAHGPAGGPATQAGNGRGPTPAPAMPKPFPPGPSVAPSSGGAAIQVVDATAAGGY